MPNEWVMRFGWGYLGVRAAYVANYYYTETEGMSQVRTVLWWIGNVACISAVVKAANRWTGDIL